MKNNVGLPEMIPFEYKSSLEKILAYSVSDEKATKCARRLMDRYGTLATIFSENAEEIARIGGVGMNTALLVKLIAYLNSRRVTDAFEMTSKNDELGLRAYIKALFLGASVETVYAILLDDKGRVISAEYISEGTVNASDVIPRKILECARKKKSKNVILAHNHPKGGVTPSKDDVMTTGRLFTMFASVGVRLCAHYIVADDEIGRIETDMLYNPDYRT